MKAYEKIYTLLEKVTLKPKKAPRKARFKPATPPKVKSALVRQGATMGPGTAWEGSQDWLEKHLGKGTVKKLSRRKDENRRGITSDSMEWLEKVTELVKKSGTRASKKTQAAKERAKKREEEEAQQETDNFRRGTASQQRGK